MSLKKNTIANYTGRFYVALIGIVIVPVYLTYLGKESYGLVAVYSMAQGLMQLLDMGLSTTIAREAACYNAGKYKANLFKKLFTNITQFFFLIATMIIGVGILGSDWIANSWLNIEKLPDSEVTYSITVIAVTVALRWATGPFRSVIVGFERQVLLNTLNIIFTTLRFVVVLPVMISFGKDLTTFFTWQLISSLMELITFGLFCINYLPAKTEPVKKDEYRALVKPVLKFALGVAFTSGVWVVITQLDKLVLSKLLPLGEYGIFTMMVMAASGIMILSGPISQAVLPRMTALKAQDEIDALQKVYSQATQFISLIVAPASMILAFYAVPVIFLWTGDPAIAKDGAPILFWYALGNGLLALSAFPYYLQYAYGDLKLHVTGNVIFAITLIPSIILAAIYYGALGAALVWFGQNLLYLLGWTWVVHKKFMSGKHLHWVCRDVLPMFVISLIFAWLTHSLIPLNELSRFELFVVLIVVSFSGFCLNILFSSYARDRLISYSKRFSVGHI